jgi:hypothetical protein
VIPQPSSHTSFVEGSGSLVQFPIPKDDIPSGDNEMSDDTLGGDTFVTNSLDCFQMETGETEHGNDLDTSVPGPYGPRNEVEQIFGWVW